ncbi:uncharacterized protein LOC131667474 [Phymastichus coffea]|uniref:uncharacterized protein LOC131667474 n=1 Tax=Phymastichus coffea TaxID=108790 RepID=UPI00273CC2C9|nr:uncharacterized protein LOC131667474 [Phymastichus coffea]
MEYGSFIYFPKRIELAEKLELIQRNAIRAALGYRNSTPNNVIIAESKLPLMIKRIEFLCKCFLVKSISNNNSQTAQTISKFYYIVQKKKKISSRLISKCLATVMVDHSAIETRPNLLIYQYQYETLATSIPIETELGNRLKESNNANEEFMQFMEKSHAVSVYTDGSKISEGLHTGAACYCPDLNIHIKKALHSRASVYTAECLALNEAIDIAFLTKNREIFIFSDSLSALESLKSTKINSTTNSYILEIKRKYKALSTSNRNVTFFWIPSHKGISGNEQADVLAKEATESTSSDITAIPFTNLYEDFKKQAYAESEKIYLDKSVTTGTIYFNNYYKSSRKPWFVGRSLKREFIITINRCRANHYNLAASMYRKNLVNDPKCKCQNEDEDLNHVLWQCALYEEPRKKLHNSLMKFKLFPPLCIEMLIADPNIEACICVFEFLKKMLFKSVN